MGTIFALILAALSFHQLSFWKNGETLLTHTLAHNPKSWLAHNNLGSYWEKQDRLEEAFASYSRSAQVKPSPTIFNNMGAVAIAARQYEKAEMIFREGLKADPDALPNLHGLGLALLAQGKNAAAEQILKEALRKNPGFTQAADLLEENRFVYR